MVTAAGRRRPARRAALRAAPILLLAPLVWLAPAFVAGDGPGEARTEERSTRQLLQAGSIALDEENWKQAEARFREAADIDPRLVQAHFGMALAALGTHDRRAAEKALRTALGLAPNQPEIRYALGAAAFASGDVRGAEIDLKAAADADHRFLEARYALGLVAAQRGDLPGAKAALQDALKLDASYAPAHYQLGAVLARSGDLEGSLQEMSRATAREPSLREARQDDPIEFRPRAVPPPAPSGTLGLLLPVVRPALAWAKHRTGPSAPGEAAEIPDWFIYYQMALQQEDAGQWSGSVDLLQKALVSKDRSEGLAVVANRLVDFSPHMHLADAYYRLGNFREAFLHLGLAKNEGNASPEGLRALNVLVQKDRLRPRIYLDALPDKTTDEAIAVRGLIVADEPVQRVEISGREAFLKPATQAEIAEHLSEAERAAARQGPGAQGGSGAPVGPGASGAQGVRFEVTGQRLAEGSNLVTVRPFFRNPARDGDVLEARVVRLPPAPPPAPEVSHQAQPAPNKKPTHKPTAPPAGGAKPKPPAGGASGGGA
jgi:tetratricopeptide (TPR) repeat protein